MEIVSLVVVGFFQLHLLCRLQIHHLLAVVIVVVSMVGGCREA